jgi:hypothetical protein
MGSTSGYPFFVQLYGDALWKGSRGEPITLADFRRLRPEILRVLDARFFEARHARASAAERRLMGWLAAEGERSCSACCPRRSLSPVWWWRRGGCAGRAGTPVQGRMGEETRAGVP